MSRWTHITSCISVDTCKGNKKRIKKSIIDYIAKAPKITGSEGDASIYLNLQHGYNISSWKQDKHGDYIKYQSCIIISIQGDLRDKDGETTKEEFIEFLNYIKNEYIVRDYSINIEDDWSDESITKI
mgnify:CR=1 FL=1